MTTRLAPIAATLLACAIAWLAFSQSGRLLSMLGLADFDLPARLCLVFLVLCLFEAAIARLRARFGTSH